MAKTDVQKEMKRSDHCEEIWVKALISKNNSICKNAVSQALLNFCECMLNYRPLWKLLKISCFVKSSLANIFMDFVFFGLFVWFFFSLSFNNFRYLNLKGNDD